MVTEVISAQVAGKKGAKAPQAGVAGAGFPDLGKKHFSYFAILFYLLLEAMSVRQNTVLSESKELGENTSIQNKLNKEDQAIKFAFVPSNATSAEINQVQEENEQYAAAREDIQNNLITARQVAQVTMTRTSTNVNILQQDASENSGWLKTLNNMFRGIIEMTKNLK